MGKRQAVVVASLAKAIRVLVLFVAHSLILLALLFGGGLLFPGLRSMIFDVDGAGELEDPADGEVCSLCRRPDTDAERPRIEPIGQRLGLVVGKLETNRSTYGVKIRREAWERETCLTCAILFLDGWLESLRAVREMAGVTVSDQDCKAAIEIVIGRLGGE